MATFTNIDQERLVEVHKHDQRKANTLGGDKPAVEEPFSNSEIILRQDFYSQTPTSDTSFAAPNYGDWPSGSVASRREKIRLHPLITSGLSGPSSIQAFVAVSATPASDSTADIESVRIKHLVPPDLSIGRTNANDPDPNFRGFELALFPAYSVNDNLDAYDGYGPISTLADPSAENGIGSGARWTVDYANGIVRFTEPPLNGATGIMNPFNVYGNISGQETTVDNNGRITIFATFYQYTGTTLVDSDATRVVTVGDGTNSFGTYYGATHEDTQTAVDLLTPYGGTVYIKEGDYVYGDTVTVPANVNIVGLTRRAEVTKPSNLPAFSLSGSNASVVGLTIKPALSSDTRADIEITTASASQTIENINIKDNILHAAHDAYGVSFAPNNMNTTFRNINISNNFFDSPSFDRPVYIGEGPNDASVTLENIIVSDNDFTITTDSIDGYAVFFTGQSVEDIRELHITNNHMRGNIDIGVDINQVLENVYVSNNTEMRNIHLNGLSGSFIKNNVCNDIYLDGYITDSQCNENILYGFYLTESVNDFSFTNNECLDRVSFLADSLDLSGSGNISDLFISENRIHGSLDIMRTINAPGEHYINDLSIENNTIHMGLNIATDIDSGVVTGIQTNNLKIEGNRIDSGSMYVIATTFSSGSSNNVMILGNYVNGEFRIGGGSITTLCVSDNNTTGIFEARRDVTGISCTGNTFDEMYFNDTVDNGVISNNRALTNDLEFNDAITKITLSGNILQNYLTFDAITDVVISGNTVFGDFTTLAISNCTISDNDIGQTAVAGNFTLGAITDSVISGNNILLVFGSSTWSGSSFSNNKVGGNLTATSLTNSKMDDNMLAAVTFTVSSGTSPVFDTSIFSNNILSSNLTVLIAAGATGMCAADSNINGNNVTGNVVITRDNLASTNYVMEDSTFNDNVVSGTVSIDYDTAASTSQSLNRTILIGNKIGSTLDIGTNGATTGIVFNSAIISSNVIFGSTTIGASGRTATQLSYNDLTFGDNVLSNSFTVYGDLTSSTIGNNAFGDDVSIGRLSFTNFTGNSAGEDGAGTLTLSGGIINQSNFVGNTIYNAFVISNVITDSNINSNTVYDTFTIASAITNSIINDNNFTGVVSFNAGATLTETSFSGNHSTAAVTFADDISSSIINGNVLDNTVDMTFSGVADASLVTGNVISNNKCQDLIFSGTCKYNTISSNATATIQLIGGISKLNNVITDNIINILTVSSSSIQDSIISDNNIYRIDGTATFTDCMISNNSVTTTVSINLFSGGIFSNNNIDASLTFLGGTSNAQISSNEIGTNINFNSTLSDSILSLNRVGTDIIFIDTVSDSSIIGNYCGDEIILPNEDCDDVVISSNNVNNFDTNAANGGQTFTKLTLSDNISRSTSLTTLQAYFVGSSINNNTFSGNLLLQVDNTNTATLYRSSVSDNYVDGYLAINNIVSSGITVKESDVSGNKIIGSLDIDSALGDTSFKSTINDNTAQGVFTLTTQSISSQALRESTVDGNMVASTFTINNEGLGDTALSSTIIGNTSGGSMLIGTSLTSTGVYNVLEDCVVSSNSAQSGMQFGNVSRDGDISTYTDSVFNGNSSAANMAIYGKIDNSVIDGNVVSAGMILGSMSSSQLSDNIVGTTTTVGSGSGTTPIVNTSNISNNLFIGDFTATTGGIWNTCIIGNNFSDHFNMTDAALFGSSVSGNHFEQVTVGRVEQDMWTGNRHTAAILFDYDGSGVGWTPPEATEKTTFSGNYCGSTFTVQTSSDPGSAYDLVANCSYTGNVFDGYVTFGLGDYAHKYDNMVFSNNTGIGHVQIYTSADFYIDNMQIVGNAMSGSLIFSGSSSPNVPSIGEIAGALMIALNSFENYSGVALDNSAAMGWGVGKNVGNGPDSDIYSSNILNET